MKQPITKLLSVLAVIGIVGAGAFAFMGSAAAEPSADGTTYASTLELHGESANGQVDEITVGSSGYVEWKNLPTDADNVTVTLLAQNADGEWQRVSQESFDINGSEGSYSYDGVEGKLIASTDYTSEDFSAGKDGNVTKEHVPLKVVVDVYAEDGTACYLQEIHQVATTVENLPDPEASTDTELFGNIEMNTSTDDHCPTC